MKKKSIIKTLKQSFVIFIISFIFLFFQIKFCGLGTGIQPGAAPYKYQGITFKETMGYIDFIALVSLGASLIYFIIGYGYNKSKYEKKYSQEEEKMEKKNNVSAK